MPTRKKTPKTTTKARRPAAPATSTKGKVGASREAAQKVGGKLDFGTPAGRARPANRRVKTKLDRPSQRSGQDGQRVVGVGAVGDTPGKSGGAVDTDILGIGTFGGSSVSTDGTLGKRKGKDLTTKGGSAPFASGRPSKTAPDKNLVGKVGGSKRVRGTTHNAGQDVTSGGGGTGVGDMVDIAQNEIASVDPLAGGAPGRRNRNENQS